MGRSATVWAIWTLALGAGAALGQGTPAPADWRHIGNALIDRELAGLATGPVDRVWYSQDGSRILIQTASGRVWESDLESWKQSPLSPADPVARFRPARVPESGASVRTQQAQSFGSLYAFGLNAWRSSDGGASWDNLTGFRDASILGARLSDLAVSPRSEDEIVVAGANGVFRSADAGRSWSGLNQGLPNLPGSRILGLPSGDRGLLVGLADGTGIEWAPGEKRAWQPMTAADHAAEVQARRELSARFGAQVSALTIGAVRYAGLADGRLTISLDRGQTWQAPFRAPAPDLGPVERIWLDPEDPRMAIAVLGSRTRSAFAAAGGTHVLRTVNGGVFWDDITANLPESGVHGVVADRASGTIYIGTDQGVFYTTTDLAVRGAIDTWTPVAGLPLSPVMDVRLDPGANQLWALVDGFGVYATLAPHRLRDPRVVSSADFVARALSPGALVSVLGAKIDSARTGDLPIPVLDANAGESQLQIPFEASGSSVSLTVKLGATERVMGPLTLASASPAIIVDRDGSPMLLDADSSVMLDRMTPAHAGARLQVLATGMGRVKPDWPTGLAAPLENPPAVAGNVRAYLDRTPVEVTRATLAPGYIGFYLVEVVLPKIVNYGAAELYLEVDGQASNRVRVFVGQ
jgi:uncharacterized protein (TIGR03437 family)